MLGDSSRWGLDVGYRMPTDQLFLEVMLGFSEGRGWERPVFLWSVFTSLDSFKTQRENKWVWDFNPNLLRVGGRF